MKRKSLRVLNNPTAVRWGLVCALATIAFFVLALRQEVPLLQEPWLFMGVVALVCSGVSFYGAWSAGVVIFDPERAEVRNGPTVIGFESVRDPEVVGVVHTVTSTEHMMQEATSEALEITPTYRIFAGSMYSSRRLRKFGAILEEMVAEWRESQNARREENLRPRQEAVERQARIADSLNAGPEGLERFLEGVTKNGKRDPGDADRS